MDEIEINTELKKINALHGSLDENNVITYIIFLESYRHKLNTSQIDWLDVKIDTLVEKSRQKVEQDLSKVDVELAKKPIHDKYSAEGRAHPRMDETYEEFGRIAPTP